MVRAQNRNPHEVEISQYFLSDILRSDPRNHCVPVIDTLNVPDDPDLSILVCLFCAKCNSPGWSTIGELVSFLIQIIEVKDDSSTLLCGFLIFISCRAYNSCTINTLHIGKYLMLILGIVHGSP